MNFFKILLFLNFKFFFNYFNKLINILSMSSFLFNTFINLYLGLVVSYIRDLNPKNNFSITASWRGSMLANSFKFKSAQGSCIHKPSGISQFWDFLSVFSIGSMVSGQFCFWPTVNQREGQIMTEYLAVLVEIRIKVLIFWLRKASRLEPRLTIELVFHSAVLGSFRKTSCHVKM